jgi:Fic family protein
MLKGYFWVAWRMWAWRCAIRPDLAVLTEEVVKTSEIEGDPLNIQSVRSSIARRLGGDIGALAPVDRHVEGVVEMVLNATATWHAPVSRERLFGWQAALFPTGYSGFSRINVSGWRDDASGPMQGVSGPIGRQTVHCEAPPAESLEAEISRFLAWINGVSNEPPPLKAGLGHLWFVTLHPFDDLSTCPKAISNEIYKRYNLLQNR